MVHVLVVEDSQTQAARLCADLEASEFLVSHASSGAEALRLLEGAAIDVVASDVVMPGMSGYDLCRTIKDDPRLKDIPVVLLTSLTDPLEVVNGLESGADNFIRKPYDKEQLVARLRASVANRELRREGRVQVGVQLSFLDREFDITADRQQILDLLVSTFEELVVTSREVRKREEELEEAHADLQQQLHLVELERQRLGAVVDAVPVPLFVTASDGCLSHVSSASARALEVDLGACKGHGLDEVVQFVDADGKQIPRELLPHNRVAETGLPSHKGEAFDLFVARPGGDRVPVVLQASPIVDEFKRSTGCVATAHTVGGLTEHDPLTGLPNSATFLDRSARLLGAPHGKAGLMIVALDRFEVTEASLSLQDRNAVLFEAARRLRQCFDPHERVASASSSFLSYLGGHQFGVLLTNLPDSFQVVHLAEAARRTISSTPTLRDGVVITASIGVALDDGDQRAPHLFAAASEALRNAQEHGGNRVEILGASAAREAMERLSLENDLRAALELDEITLHYQPEYDLNSGDVVGFEALARWQHPRIGAIPPPVFISLAEQSGMILALGERLLRMACAEAASWSAPDSGRGLSVAVNVSALQLRPGFVTVVTDALSEAGLPAERLMLEVTETVAMTDPEVTIPIIDELRRMGIRFALDDFGTGYSSLTQLTRVAFDQLKLDRSFVSAIHLPGVDSTIARSIITLAQSLEIPVLAEGVETKTQARELRDLGAAMCQGFLYSKPIPSDQIAGFLSGSIVNHADPVITG